MNLSSNKHSTSLTSSPQICDDRHVKLIEKFINDLENIVAKLTDLQKHNPHEAFSDDCVDLQKFCFKLEFLIQFKLKEKKSLFEVATLAVPSSNSLPEKSLMSAYANRDYWTFFVEVLKSSRGFQDAIKYVKNLNELKTNLGRGRAFIRFCLQYHRLADAVQQLMMEDKIVNNWYLEKSVWFDVNQKSRIFGILYELNEINFDLLTKSNFELDTTWPLLHSINSKQNIIKRNRTSSFSSYSSSYIDREQADNQLLSSTPFDIDNDFLFTKMNQDQNKSSDMQSYQFEIENQESKITELTTRLAIKDSQLEIVFDELKKKKCAENDSTDSTSLNSQIQILNEQLNMKITQCSDLNNCLIKQTNLCDNLTNLLKQNQEKNSDLEITAQNHLITIENLQNNLENLNKELRNKKIQEENLLKETLSQTQSIVSLKLMCSQQENTINQMKKELDSIKEERAAEININAHKTQRNLVALQLKEEENYLLNDQIQKLSKSLDEERTINQNLNQEILDLKLFIKKLNEKNDQLDDDNNEIKKRLVKLIKEKAELWQKADNLEYENILKSNAMWIDDANVSNCMACNSGFSLLLRKHHCRICLKIFCYYCCNNWIEYNNSQLRVCQRCFESRNNASQLNQPEVFILKNNPSQPINQVGIDEDESDPDINFEVRSVKLNISAFNSAGHSSDEHHSIYQSSKPNLGKTQAQICSDVKDTDELSDDKMKGTDY